MSSYDIISCFELSDSVESCHFEVSGKCGFLKYKDRCFIVTCYHCISHMLQIPYEIVISEKDIKISYKKNLNFIKSYEVDFAFCEIDAEFVLENNLKAYVLHDQYNLSNFSDTRLFIDGNDCKIHRIYDLKIDFFNNYGIFYNAFENSSIIAFKGNSTIDEMDGYSGSVIKDNNDNFYGIFSAGNRNDMVIIPNIIIRRILKEFIDYGKFNGLCISCFKIANNIVNKQILHPSIYSPLNLKCLKKGDIINKVDNLDMNSFGEVYMKEIGLNVSFGTYITLTKTINDFTRFIISRSSKIISRKQILIEQGNRDLNSCFEINYSESEVIKKIIDNKVYYKINSPLLMKYLKIIEETGEDVNKHFYKLFLTKFSDGHLQKYVSIDFIGDTRFNLELYKNKPIVLNL